MAGRIALIKAEMVKIWKKKGTKGMLLLIVGILVLYSAAISGPKMDNWREENSKQLEKLRQEYADAIEGEEDEGKLEMYADLYEGDIAKYEYSLEHDIPYGVNSTWRFVYLSKIVLNITTFFLMMMIISNMQNEYQYGTIKQILTCPYKRKTILFSKQAAITLYTIITFALQFGITYLLSLIRFQNVGSVTLEYVNNQVVEIDMAQATLHYYLIRLALAIVILWIALGITAVTRSSILTIVVTMGLWLGNMALSNFLGNKPWYPYTIFPNMDAGIWLNDRGFISMNKDATQSAVVLLVNLAVIVVAYYIYFSKKDVVNEK